MRKTSVTFRGGLLDGMTYTLPPPLPFRIVGRWVYEDEECDSSVPGTHCYQLEPQAGEVRVYTWRLMRVVAGVRKT